MLSKVPSYERLVHELNRLPGVGPKTAQRLAYHLLRQNLQTVEALRAALQDVQTHVHECHVCFSYTEETETCDICQDVGRQEDILCVVEDPADIARLEQSGAYKGRYHVLHGALSPLDGVGPDSLRIAPLFERLTGGDGRIRELILALDADLEGDTTALYLAQKLEGSGIKVTRLAHGLPIGGDIDFVDFRTLGRALENRVEL